MRKSRDFVCGAKAAVPYLEWRCWAASLPAVCSEVLIKRAVVQGLAKRWSRPVRGLGTPPGGPRDEVNSGAPVDWQP